MLVSLKRKRYDTDKDKKLESLNDAVEPLQIANECTEKKMNLLDDTELTDNGQAVETVSEDNIDEGDKKIDGDEIYIKLS